MTESQKYKDCITFIGNFTTTTSDFVESFDALVSNAETVTCTGPARTWDRYLAVQCRQTDDNPAQVFIQVATNSRPPHCTASGIPEEEVINFEVRFSVNTASLTKVSMNTQILVDNKQCNSLDWTDVGSLTNAAYGYSVTPVAPQVPKGIVGVAVNGVPIHAGISDSLNDFAFPTNSALRVSVDECLGALNSGTLSGGSTNNFYQYYSFSPCIYSNALISKTDLQNCDDLTNCPVDPINYAVILNYPRAVQLRKNFFGLALDGHMISGPYIADYTLIQPCDVDACNGYTINGHYVYASTMFYPYTVACWGPASTQSMFPASCSNNNNVCLDQSYSLFGLTLNFVLILFVTLLMFY